MLFLFTKNLFDVTYRLKSVKSERDMSELKENNQEKKEFGGLMDIMSKAVPEQSDLSRIVDSLLDIKNGMSVKTNIKNPHRFTMARILSLFLEKNEMDSPKQIVDSYIEHRQNYEVSKHGEGRKAIERIGANASRSINIESDNIKKGLFGRMKR